MKSKKHTALLFLAVFLIGGMVYLLNPNQTMPESTPPRAEESGTPISASYWDNFTFIHINNNWSNWEGKPWLKGEGTPQKPYILENMTINASASPTSCGILIENSQDHFIIQNCSIYGAMDSGIEITSSGNGTINDNNIYDNGLGIYFITVSNITFSNNSIFSNVWSGIQGYEIYNSSIEHNNITQNEDGIRIDPFSSHLNISFNNISKNEEIGFYMALAKNYTLSNNTFEDNGDLDVKAQNSANCTFMNNQMTGGGMYLSGNADVIESTSLQTNNKVNGKPIYFFCDREKLTPTDFSNAGQILLFWCNDTIIQNQDISDCYVGIQLYYCINVSIKDSNFTAMKNLGIEAKHISFCNFSNNNFSSAGYGGIIIAYSYNSTSMSNTFSDCDDAAIDISQSANISLSDNLMHGCGLRLYSTSEAYIKQEIDQTNLVNGKVLYYYYKREHLGANNFHDAGQIILADCNHSLIQNVNVSKATLGITVLFSSNTTIQNVTNVRNKQYGIYVYKSDVTEISNSNVTICDKETIYVYSSTYSHIYNNTLGFSNDYAISLSGSDHNNIAYNTIQNVPYELLSIGGAEDTNVSKNEMSHAYNALFLSNSINCYIQENNFSHIQSHAISLVTVDNAQIIGNKFLNSSRSIFLNNADHNDILNNTFTNSTEYALYIMGSSTDNKAYGNYFYNSTISHAYDDTSNTAFFWGMVGNYWDDYGGKDADDDGIGDIPYNKIEATSNGDLFPIWWDAPNISILLPFNRTQFSRHAPVINITEHEGVGHTFWFTIDGNSEKYYFQPNSTINQADWDNIANGTALLHFYFNDSRNLLDSQDLIIKKDVLGPLVSISDPAPLTLYNATAPNAANFTVSISDGNGIHSEWYMLYNGSVTTDNCTWSGYIDQAVWNEIGNGTLTLRLYANDSVGNINYTEITLQKEIIYGSGPDQDDDTPDDTTDGQKDKEDNGDENPSDDGQMTTFIIIGIAAVGGISLAAILIRSRAYKSSTKEKKRIEEMLEK